MKPTLHSERHVLTTCSGTTTRLPAGINLPDGAQDVSTGRNVTVAEIDTGTRPHVGSRQCQHRGRLRLHQRHLRLSAMATVEMPMRATSERLECRQANAARVRRPAGRASGTALTLLGTIAARTNNGRGVAGVAFNARVVPIARAGSVRRLRRPTSRMVSSGHQVARLRASRQAIRIRREWRICRWAVEAHATTMQGNARSTPRGARDCRDRRGWQSENQKNAQNSSPANCSGVVPVAAVRSPWRT